MSRSRATASAPRLALPFVVAACATGTAAVQAPQAPQAPRTAQAPQALQTPQTLPDSLRWTRSAEYVAVCLQTFNLALERLRALPADAGDTRTTAVVMDLDETVLDNFGFQRELVRDGARFDAARWNAWVARDEAALVPGAASFIQGVRALGIEVVFLSNRDDASRDATLATLRRLGVARAGVEPPLYLKQATSDKAPRRQQIETRYRVLAYFGDNLADFDRGFDGAPRGDRRASRARACELRQRWGTQWYVLPNPMYGAWAHDAGDASPDAALPCP